MVPALAAKSVSFKDLADMVQTVRDLSVTLGKHEAVILQLIDRVSSLERRLDRAEPPRNDG